jgi:hypothetical protein
MNMKSILLVSAAFYFFLFFSGSCGDRIEQPLIIQNNSEQEIVVLYSYFPMNNECFVGGNETKQEYKDFMYYRAIKSYSSKNLSGLGSSVVANKQDTTYIYVFNRIDMDTMPCEEFKQKYPLKKEWKVTLADMEACDWTLVYP